MELWAGQCPVATEGPASDSTLEEMPAAADDTDALMPGDEKATTENR